MSNNKDFSVEDLILAVLHAVSMEKVPQHMLIQIGEYMGLSADVIKLSLDDLIKRDYIESDDDLAYSILPKRTLFSQHFEQWRLSEKRRIPWDGSWIVCELPKAPENTSDRKKSLWALGLLGFRKSDRGMLRPNNLLGGIDALRIKLSIFGIEDSAELYSINDYSEYIQDHLKTNIWPIDQLNEKYDQNYLKVETGLEMINGTVSKTVLIYALKTGYEGITLLATDPLLPEEMQDPSSRIKLTRIMKEYESLGKKYWEHVIPGLRFS